MFPPDTRPSTKPKNYFFKPYFLLFQDRTYMESLIYDFFSYESTIATNETSAAPAQDFTSDWAPGQ